MYDAIANSIFKGIEQYQNIRKAKLDNFAKLNLLKLEIRLNLHIIDKIETENIQDHISNPELKKLIGFMETEILHMIFLEGILHKKNSLRSYSIEAIKDSNNNISIDFLDDDNKINQLKTPTQVCEALYLSIKELKIYTSIDLKNANFMPKIILKTRLTNLKKNLEQVHAKLLPHKIT